jgi:hypothetical protein
MKELEHRNQANTGRTAGSDSGPSPGKRTLTESLSGDAAGSTGAVQRSAAETPGASSALHSMGSLFGRDFSAVQLHTNDAADSRARSLGTEAVTEGRDIHFRHGAFAPDTRHGKEVLGHELAHVVQQQDHAPTAQTYVPVGARGDAFEQEASRAGAAVAAGERPTVELRTSFAVQQRFEANEHSDIGDYTKKNIMAADGVPLNAEDKARMASDDSKAAGGGKFGDGMRSLSMDLRIRDPLTNLPQAGGATQPVKLSYGEMVALSGDLYYSLDNMKMAPADEVLATRNLVARQQHDPEGADYDIEFQRATKWRAEGVYQPGTGKNEGTKAQYWGMHPQGKPEGKENATYLELAGDTSAHFSPATGTAVDHSASAPEGNAAKDNRQAWNTDHDRAIAIAKQVRTIKKGLGLIASSSPASAPTSPTGASPTGAAPNSDKPPPNGQPPKTGAPTANAPNAPAPTGNAPAPTGNAPAPTGGAAGPAPDWHALENDAYLHNAAADHYLTDAFSAGHLVNPGALAPVTDKVLTPSAFEGIVDMLAPFAMKDNSINWTKWVFGIGFGLESWVVKPKLRAALSIFKTDKDKAHSVGLKLVHDWLNENGVMVTSKNGKFTWKTKGDAHIDAATKDIASRGVLASRNYIRAVMNDSDADLGKPENADDAFEYTPNVDATAYAAKCEPGMRYKLSQGEYLWNLMKKAQLALDEQAKDKKVEDQTAESAKKDKGGDWGQQPSNSRFTKRMIVTTHKDNK